MSSARSALRERGVSLEALEACPPGEGPVELDPQFLGQVEGMCQWDMVASLKEAGQSLDEHARVSVHYSIGRGEGRTVVIMLS